MMALSVVRFNVRSKFAKLCMIHSFYLPIYMLVLYPLYNYTIYKKVYEPSAKMKTSSTAPEVKHLRGFQKYFNTTTINGRVNISCATFATIGMYLLYLKFKPKSEMPKTKQ